MCITLKFVGSRIEKISFNILFIFILFILSGFEAAVFCSDDGAVRIKYVFDEGFDIDGDGLFEYLEIQVEANVSLPGIYILETGELVDPSGRTIAVTAYKKLILDAGEHIFTILLDGRMIHQSGLNPMNISYIGVISEDYREGDFLNNISLTREYDFTEFEAPPLYGVGVKEGDWIRYLVFHFWSSTDPSATEPGNYPDEILIKVEKIERQLVSVEIGFHYPSGDDLKEVVKGYLEKESQIFPFLLPANLSLGDPFGQSGDARIDGTSIENILGKDREVNQFHTRNNIPQPNVDVLLEQKYLWDKRTSILIKSWINMTMTDLLTGHRSHSNISFSIVRTNIIPQSTSLILDEPSDIKLGMSLNISAILLDFHDKGIEGEQIVFESIDNEIGWGITDSDGRVKIEYEPEKTGICRIKAIFTGSEEFLPTENLIIFNVKVSTSLINQMLLLLLLLSISTFAILWFKKRSIKK